MSSSIVNLYKAQKNKMFTVSSVPDIGLLENLGVREGTRISLQNRYALGGPVVLRIENAYSVALGKDVAGLITVTDASVA